MLASDCFSNINMYISIKSFCMSIKLNFDTKHGRINIVILYNDFMFISKNN